jgi:hypothetical protein
MCVALSSRGCGDVLVSSSRGAVDARVGRALVSPTRSLTAS